MQLIMTIIVGSGLLLFLGLILWMSVATILDVIANGLDSKSSRRERDRMMGDPKDRP
jgi:hypothetical protein